MYYNMKNVGNSHNIECVLFDYINVFSCRKISIPKSFLEYIEHTLIRFVNSISDFVLSLPPNTISSSYISFSL